MKTEVKAETVLQDAPQGVEYKALPADKHPDTSAAMNHTQQEKAEPLQLDASQLNKNALESQQQLAEEVKIAEPAKATQEEQHQPSEAPIDAPEQTSQPLGSSLKDETDMQQSGAKAESATANGNLEEPAQKESKSSMSFMDLLTGKGEPDKQPVQSQTSLFRPLQGGAAQGASALRAVPRPSQPSSQSANAITAAYEKIAGGPLSAQTFSQVFPRLLCQIFIFVPRHTLLKFDCKWVGLHAHTMSSLKAHRTSRG